MKHRNGAATGRERSGEGGRTRSSGGSRTRSTEHDREPRIRVMLEVLPSTTRRDGRAARARLSEETTFTLDAEFAPIAMSGASTSSRSGDAAATRVIRGAVREDHVPALRQQPDVRAVWLDPIIEPHATDATEPAIAGDESDSPARATHSMLDCDRTTASADALEAARYLGADAVWCEGIRGRGVIIGLVDGGIDEAALRPLIGAERVIDGSVADWGRVARWNGHGNMMAANALALAPQARLYDLRIADGDLLSDALRAFQWALDRHRRDGTPHVLSNSWGISRSELAPDYATNVDHVFTRKVVEAVDAGIIVLFSAGNCGAACYDMACRGEHGPGKGIWGANGHPRVVTVGAATVRNRLAGYSSVGPAALHARKPDVCGVTHVRNLTACDAGTSTACATVAGVVALLKEANPELGPEAARRVLAETANAPGGGTWDPQFGAGVVRADAAWRRVASRDAREPLDRGRAAKIGADDAASPRTAGDDLLDALMRRSPFQYSGRYEFNGGASSGEGRGFVDRATGISRAALRNPSYELEEPVYLEEPAPAGSRAAGVRFTLHVDVDGPDALMVVSGVLAKGPPQVSEASPHFMGRVTDSHVSGDRRRLVVEGFTFRWPGTASRINRLIVRLAGSVLVTPTAEVTFHDTVRKRRYGPYSTSQASPFFRQVEVDVDREKNALDVEPCSTHAHPDRPEDLAQEEMTLESAFGRAGIRITRSPGSGTIIETEEAGPDRTWSYGELHDSMQLHWDAFANRPQWKMWIFLAGRADDETLGGVMFDGEIDEPGGVDRQGTAIFTRCPYFHTTAGAYVQANPPASEAIRRELFFNLIHETGHAFNLAHSFDKHLAVGPGEHAWTPPSWMELTANRQALSWMNYPDAATPYDAGVNASWFYRRFRFRFDDAELLFLRHAPGSYVQMGNAAWFQNHGRVARHSLDPRIELRVRGLKPMVELGEPVMLELRLGLAPGASGPVLVHTNLDPADGLVEVAVTNPRGERRPFIPIEHTRRMVRTRMLEPDGAAVYEPLDMSIGRFGIPFKEPGAHRIEASYTNVNGATAAAVTQLHVHPPREYGSLPILNRMFDARLGRVLYVGGTRALEDVNAEIDELRARLPLEHPATVHLTTMRTIPCATASKVVDAYANRVRTVAEDPDAVVKNLTPLVTDDRRVADTADTLGHIFYREVVHTYVGAARDTGAPARAAQAQGALLDLLTQRGAPPSVLAEDEKRLRELR